MYRYKLGRIDISQICLKLYTYFCENLTNIFMLNWKNVFDRIGTWSNLRHLCDIFRLYIKYLATYVGKYF
jgi:hypothetical protein